MSIRDGITRGLKAVLFCSAAAVSQSAHSELRDDFSSYDENSDGSPKWARYLGRWVMREGRCEQTDVAARSAYLFFTEQMLSDLDFSVRFKALPEGDGVRTPGMAFRAMDNLNCFYAHFYTRGSQLILVRRTRDKPWHELARIRGVSIPENQWHTGRIMCKGDAIKVYLNGKLIVERRDSTFPIGCVGLRCGQGHVLFDDLVLKGTQESGRFVMQKDPNDESGVARVEGIEDFPVVKGAGYFPVLVKLKHGSLGAAVRGGDGHIGIKGRLDWIHSEDGGKTWSDPDVIVDSKWDDRNAGVGVMQDGTVVMAYAEASTYNAEGKWDRSCGKYTLFYVYSLDNGRSWSDKIALCPELFHSGSPYGRITTLGDGTALMQIYTWQSASEKALGKPAAARARCVGVLRSTDNGRTWGDWSVVAEDYNEISLVEMRDGRLVAAMRSQRGGTDVCESLDKGRTWTAPRTVTKVSHHPPDLCLLKTGTLLMVYGCRLNPKGVQAIISDDGGKTWSFDKRVFLAWQALNGDCGYPSAVQVADGTIVMLYYAVGTSDLEGRQCRCVRFAEEHLRGKEGGF